ncbi:MAG: FHA domain-containing protein [Planctomycetaceae bacterium]|nr:MAG: FHA domain-containing protein [Planctomycetaceae bacterium]
MNLQHILQTVNAVLLTLEATQGAAAGRTVIVRDGQTVQVGRSRWADLCLDEDPQLSEVHFELQCDWKGCRIRDLQSASGTFVNDAKVDVAPLQSGDSVVAGTTTFTVSIEGEDQAAGELVAGAEGAAAPTAPAAVYCRDLDWSEPAQQLLQEDLPPADYLDRLIAADLLPDAVRFLAAWLPKPAAVAWACGCVRSVLGESLGPSDQAALDAAEAWAAEPEESKRRAAEAAAETCQYTGPAASVALAAFWSEGSLAPPDLAPVPPPETATAKAVTGALMTAAPCGDPRQTPQRYRAFLDAGKLAEKGLSPT